jgi:predicted nuclease with TOPRIM domain
MTGLRSPVKSTKTYYDERKHVTVRNKLEERYHEIDAEVKAIKTMINEQADVEIVQARIVEIEARQSDLDKTLRHLIALAHLRDEAHRALSY